MIRGLLAYLNHIMLVAICFYLIISEKFIFKERAIYDMSAVLFWMELQRIIKKLVPAD